MTDALNRAATSLDCAMDSLTKLDTEMKAGMRAQAAELWQQFQTSGVKISLDTRLPPFECEVIVGGGLWDLMPPAQGIPTEGGDGEAGSVHG